MTSKLRSSIFFYLGVISLLIFQITQILSIYDQNYILDILIQLDRNIIIGLLFLFSSFGVIIKSKNQVEEKNPIKLVVIIILTSIPLIISYLLIGVFVIPAIVSMIFTWIILSNQLSDQEYDFLMNSKIKDEPHSGEEEQ